MLGKRPRPIHRPPTSSSLPHPLLPHSPPPPPHHRHHHHHLRPRLPILYDFTPSPPPPPLPPSSSSPRSIVIGFDLRSPSSSSSSSAQPPLLRRMISSNTSFFVDSCDSPRSVLDPSALSTRNSHPSLDSRRAQRSGLCASLLADKTRHTQAFFETAKSKGGLALEIQAAASVSVAATGSEFQEESRKTHVNGNHCPSGCRPSPSTSSVRLYPRNRTRECEKPANHLCFDDEDMDMALAAESSGAAIFAAASPPKDDFCCSHMIPAPDFHLDLCRFCGSSLHGKDIYMYRGDQAFCSADCRYQQILIDES